VPEKPCIDCGEVKPLSAFYRDPRRSDGHVSSCKVCRRAYQMNRPPEAIAEIERRRTQNPANPANPARKAHLARNLKKWRQENPTKAAVQRDRNRAMRRECEGHYTAAEFKELCDKYGNICLRCGDKDAPLTPDHVIPLSLGDSNWKSNIQPLCRRCNSRKNVKIIDYRHGGVPLR
jgi:5-methylcytosine-specific restriction endonuclease McrA